MKEQTFYLYVATRDNNDYGKNIKKGDLLTNNDWLGLHPYYRRYVKLLPFPIAKTQ